MGKKDVWKEAQKAREKQFKGVKSDHGVKKHKGMGGVEGDSSRQNKSFRKSAKTHSDQFKKARDSWKHKK